MAAFPPFHCWSYKRPVGHSKSSAVLRGDAPMITEWAYAMLAADGVSFETSRAVSGFATEDDARNAALEVLSEGAAGLARSGRRGGLVMWYWCEAFDAFGDRRYFESRSRVSVDSVLREYERAGYSNITRGSYRG